MGWSFYLNNNLKVNIVFVKILNCTHIGIQKIIHRNLNEFFYFLKIHQMLKDFYEPSQNSFSKHKFLISFLFVETYEKTCYNLKNFGGFMPFSKVKQL